MKISPRKSFICLLIIAICLVSFPFGLSATAENCPNISGGNIEANNYGGNYAKPINSYLVPLSNGEFMRFQNGITQNAYLVEYYTKDFKLKSHKIIPAELSVFGGFYATENNYYILSGENNFKESATVECFRITKYSLDWKRIGSTGLKDCNTFIPFDAGCARFAHDGKYLVVRTCHEMYADSKGIHHQSNVTIQLDTETMKITDEFTDVGHYSAGYISHSFNQFLKIENDHIIALDHGDAHLRSVVLTKFPTYVSTGKFQSWKCETTEAVPIPGTYGDNFTGIEVGGFEISESAYIIAYTSVKLDENFKKHTTKNIFITAVDKSNGKITTKSITDIKEGKPSAGCPHLVKISNNKFALLWSENGDVAYVYLDKNGNAISAINYAPDYYLSDCAPIYKNGLIIWYANNNESTTVYTIDTVQNATKNYSLISGHEIILTNKPEFNDYIAKVKCENCSYTEIVKVPQKLTAYWNTENGEGSYSYPIKKSDFKIGDELYFMIDTNAKSDEKDDLVIEFSDESAFYLVPETSDCTLGKLQFKKAGTYTIKFAYKYNPTMSKSITVNVSCGVKLKLGDVNMNGAIDARDYIFLKRTYFGTYKIPEEAKPLADVNKNGMIDARDYIYLKRAYFGTFKIE